MRVPIRAVAGAAGLTLAVALAAPVPVLAAAAAPQAAAGAAGAVVAVGHAAAATTVSVNSANAFASAHAAALARIPAAPREPLSRTGIPAGSAAPASSPAATRPAPPATTPSGPNTAAGGAATSAAHVVTSAVPAASPILSSFAGVSESSAGCGSCTTPDPSAAVSSTEIAETVNLTLDVFNKSGTSQCTMSLAGLFGAVTALSRPRVVFDNAASRFTIVTDSVPGSSSDAPVQYLAASQTADACGAWHVYSLVFGPGNTNTPSLYPLGVLLDYPTLGQDATNLLTSTNNFASGGSYVGSAAYAFPKPDVYAGSAFSFNIYQVAFSTQPPQVAGIPTFSTSTTYWLAAVPGTGFDLYSMPTSPAGAITLVRTVSASFSAPPLVTQPGTSDELNPLDGRIQSSIVQDGSFVWFTNDVNDAGLATVLYGAINVSNGQLTDAVAFHSANSQDFNPSIGVSDAGGGTNFIWVNWAYTNVANRVPVTATVAGVGPGAGVPNLEAVDVPIFTGSSTSSITSFGGYSSTAVDPAATSGCPAGETALTNQEVFTSSGTWTTRLSESTFC